MEIRQCSPFKAGEATPAIAVADLPIKRAPRRRSASLASKIRTVLRSGLIIREIITTADEERILIENGQTLTSSDANDELECARRKRNGR